MAAALAVVTGLVSGLLSGLFGIGGGLVTTPAIRLVLGYPALIAVGTPLPVILPTAVTGALAYARRGLADVRAGVVMGVAGTAGSVAGAWLSDRVGGSALMLATAALVIYVALDMAVHSMRGAAPVGSGVAGEGESDLAEAPEVDTPPDGAHTSPWRLVLIGVATGLYSGLLGLGGGFIVVPALSRWMGMPLKRAIGTSLVTVAVLAVPGSVAHWLLGHVDLPLALWLIVGTVPGAWLGARLTAAARERAVAIAFSVVLGATGVVLGVTELAKALSR